MQQLLNFLVAIKLASNSVTGFNYLQIILKVLSMAFASFHHTPPPHCLLERLFVVTHQGDNDINQTSYHFGSHKGNSNSLYEKVLKHIILESNQVCAKEKGVSSHNTKSLTDWLIVGSVFVEYHTSCMLKTSFLEFK